MFRTERFSLASLAIAAVTAFSLLTTPTDARAKRRAAPAADVTTSSKYADIVVDARTGKVLQAKNADARRYPASLTKMMTLYLVFEAMERGKIKKSTPIVFSAQAAAQPPTKIGVRAGGSITAEQAILALVTRSANDASLALAETLGGSEQRFALMMTQKARSLGMRNTVFRNPHGLPNADQYTTARDMAPLGSALREHFPQYYGYFSTRSFQFGRQRIGNHNRLLGRIRGVDGIKTGYTNASGFNLVSSVNDNNRKVVAVVMGGYSGRARDARMAQLIAANLPKAGTGGGNLVARGRAADIDDVKVAALPAKAVPTPDVKPVVAQDEAPVVAAAIPAPKKLSRAEQRKADAEARKAAKANEKVVVTALAAAPKRKPAAEAIEVIDTSETISAASGKWIVQVGSSPSQSDAKSALDKAQKVSSLAKAEAFTVPFKKGDVTYYRARLGGFASQAAAVKACNNAKQSKISCYAALQD